MVPPPPTAGCRERKQKRSAKNVGKTMPHKHFFAARSVQCSGRRSWRCKRVENLFYVTWIRRLNPVRNVRVVNGRSSSRYVVRGFGFCNLYSPNVCRRAVVTPRAFAIRVLMGSIAGLLNNTKAILPIMTTNLFQRLLELSPVVLPLSVRCCLTLPPISNLDNGIGSCARDDWKRRRGAASDRNDDDYAEYNKAEFSR